MIVPRNRLLFWVAVIALPFATLAAVVPGALPTAAAVLVALVLVALLDATLAYGSLDGIDVQLPEVVRLSKDREGVIEVRVNNRQKKSRQVRLGLALPREVTSPQEDVMVALPAGAEWSRLKWACVPLRRGRYRLDRAYVEGVSPMGFWAVTPPPAMPA